MVGRIHSGTHHPRPLLRKEGSQFQGSLRDNDSSPVPGEALGNEYPWEGLSSFLLGPARKTKLNQLKSIPRGAIHA